MAVNPCEDLLHVAIGVADSAEPGYSSCRGGFVVNSAMFMSLIEVTRRLLAELKPEQIILFGSHAWGRPADNNAVDVLVIVPHSDRQPAQRATSAHRCLRDIRFPQDVLAKPRTSRISKPAIAHSRHQSDRAIEAIIGNWGSRGVGRSCIDMVAMLSTGGRRAPIVHSRFERTHPRPCVRHTAAPSGGGLALGGRNVAPPSPVDWYT